MAWDYDWKAGPKGGTLVALDQYANMIRQVGEIDAGLRGEDPIIQYRHGAHHVRKWATPREIMLEVAPRYTNAAGTVTHVDGAAGHVYENLAEIRRLLNGERGGRATLQQTAPDWGTVQLDVVQIAPALPTQQRFVFGFFLRASDPFWRDDTESTSTGNPAVGGSAPVYPTIDFVGSTDGTLTHSASGAEVKIEGAAPAGGVRVDCLAQTCTQITGGADYSAKLSLNRDYWMLLDPAATNTMSRSGGGTITVKWFDSWR